MFGLCCVVVVSYLQHHFQLFNVDVKLFAESLSSHDNTYVVEDMQEAPLVSAGHFVVEKSAYSTPERVLEGKCWVLLVEIHLISLPLSLWHLFFLLNAKPAE